MQLIVENLCKNYRGGTQALRTVQISLRPGVLGLLGPNGAGNSTLMRILATVTRASSGRVLWNETDIAHNPDALRSVLGYLPQDFGVYPNLNAYVTAARAAIPGYKDGFALTIAPGHSQVAEALRWQGVHWTSEHLLMRVGCLFAAVLITLLAALFFDRFDATRFLAPSLPKIKQRMAARAAASNAVSSGSAVASRSGSSVHLTPLASAQHSNAFGRILAAEVRLALKGFRWWWYAIAAGLLIAQIFVPLGPA
jgi:ABC-type Fe3+/spermidine/putrescine transport system ATPase subunit